MRVQIVSARRRPRIGDRRVTKRHGLQIRVPETSWEGMWVLRNGRQAYEWRTLAELAGTAFDHLIPWPRAWPNPAPAAQQEPKP